MRGRELDLRPDVRQLGIEARAERGVRLDPLGDHRRARTVYAAQVRGGIDIEAEVLHQRATDLRDTLERVLGQARRAGQRARLRHRLRDLDALAELGHQLDGLVHGLAGHPAIGGELAARDDHQAVVAREHLVLAGDLGLVHVRRGGDQRAQAGPRGDHVVGREVRAGEIAVARVTQVLHVLGVGGHLVGATGEVGVGGAEHGALAPWDREHHALVDGRDQRDRARQREALAR